MLSESGAVDRGRTCMSVGHKILSLARLPIPPRPHITYTVYYLFRKYTSLFLNFFKNFHYSNPKSVKKSRAFAPDKSCSSQISMVYYSRKDLKKYDLCSFCARLCELRVFGQKAKMEAGENPARSRHCIDGALSVYATEYFVFGKAR